MRRKPEGSADHQRSVGVRFSAAAATYDRHGAIQEEVADKVAGLAKGLRAVDILEVGCGTGILTERLVKIMPEATIRALDLSAAMISRAQARLAGCGSVLWIVGDLDTVRNGSPFDMIVSSSVLHWIQPVGTAIANMAGILVPGGYLVFGMMLEGTFVELHESRRKVAPAKMAAWKMPSENEVTSALTAAKLDVLLCDKLTLKTFVPSARDLLKILHEQGLTGGRLSGGGKPLTRTELTKLAAEYETTYKDPAKGVPATYEVMCVAARKTQ